MRAGEVTGDIWTIPATRAKNGRARAVPLPPQALDLLRAVGTGGEKPLEPDALVFPSKRGGVLSNWDRETKRLHALSSTSGWHRHDLRRAVATLLGDLGFAPHVVSVVLGHAHIADGATAVYARSRYQREHREALQALANEIARLISGGDNVVRLAVMQA
jgi:integrase